MTENTNENLFPEMPFEEEDLPTPDRPLRNDSVEVKSGIDVANGSGLNLVDDIEEGNKKKIIYKGKSKYGSRKRVETYLRPKEFRYIVKVAKDLGLSKSEYLRRVATGRKIAKIDTSQLAIIHRDFGNTGNNLNQISTHLNMGKKVETKELRKVVEELRDQCNGIQLQIRKIAET